MMRTYFLTLFLMLICAACSASPAPAAITPPPIEEDILYSVLGQGFIRCGIQGALPGFGQRRADSSYAGLDVDLCRALAAAVFGNADKVEFVELRSDERFTALKNRQIDILIRNTTWTLTRDAELGLDFGPITYYDGQGIMVKREAGIFALPDLDGKAVCIQPETTTKTNLDDTIQQLGIRYTFVPVEDLNIGMNKLDAGDCDALSADRSALTVHQMSTANPTAFVVLDVALSQEPLAPVYLEGNPRWGNVIRWTIFGIIHAERLGITSANIDTFRNSGIPEVELLLGEAGDMGSKLGLQDSFVIQAVRQLGNYGELYERNLGGLGLARGQNALWLAGGLIYAPPFR